VPLAAGAALAFKLQKKDSVAVAFFGDGAVDEGVWYETLNFASLKKLPVIFVCENNLYSTHMPLASCLADTAIAKKAATFNMPGLCVDGNDVTGVYNTAKKAIADARRGKGPALLECRTYRWLGHVGPSDDLDKGLRSKKELQSWMKKDPIKRFETELLRKQVITADYKNRLTEAIDREIEESYAFARTSGYPDVKQAAARVFR
jgi:TPP-dependent pyruvate/acetoin dehydrogenase alpha subunit